MSSNLRLDTRVPEKITRDDQSKAAEIHSARSGLVTQKFVLSLMLWHSEKFMSMEDVIDDTKWVLALPVVPHTPVRIS